MTAIAVPLQLRREGALRSRAARGDAAAFAAVYERHHQALYRYCRSILRNDEDAQDALQSTMARAFAALQDESRDFELRPWLFRIAHNEAISIVRRRPASTELDDVPDGSGDLEDQVTDREQLRMLRLDLADLPERQRAALVLRELNGLSHAEIGVVLELTPSSVKQSIFEARSALFTCREGREMDCDDVRRMLSDGDGRTLRSRGVRAHLRHCSECRRFRADLEQRPRALRALVPPLPVGSAAALLAKLLGAGTAAKLLACVAIAGGGTTLAVELHAVRRPPPATAAEATPQPKRQAPKPAATVLPTPAPAAVTVAASAPERAAPRKKAKPPRTRRTRALEAPAKRAHTAPKAAKKLKVAKPPKAVKKFKAPKVKKLKLPKAAKKFKAPKVKKLKAAKPPKQLKAPKQLKPPKPAKQAKPHK
jgi:RNA polymerase sigma factor (sigma-70 family)